MEMKLNLDASLVERVAAVAEAEGYGLEAAVELAIEQWLHSIDAEMSEMMD